MEATMEDILRTKQRLESKISLSKIESILLKKINKKLSQKLA